MLLLRFFLSSLLMASILWGSLIAFGPLVIGWAAKTLTSGELRLSSISVEPDLTIRIPRAELLNKDETVWAFSRGLEITWSFDNGRFNLDVHTGPTASASQFYASNLHLNMQPKAFTDWSSVALRLRSEGFQFVDEAVTAELLHASAIYLPPKNFLQSSSWMFENLTQPNFGVEISEVSFQTPPLSLAAELPLDEILESLLARQIHLPMLGANVASASARFDETTAEPQIEIIGKNFSIDHYDLNSDTVKLTTPVLLGRNLEAHHTLFIEGLQASDAFLGDVSAQFVDVGASDFTISGVLNIANFKLGVQRVYVGDFSGSTLSFEARSESFDGFRSLIGTISGDVGTNAALTSTAAFEVSGVDQYCSLTKCEVERIVITSEISADDEKLSGVSECVREACLKLNFSHQFRTENTNRLLRNLQKTNMFNPLAVLVARAFIKQSPKDGAGHIINF